jgi:hypothetical protein
MGDLLRPSAIEKASLNARKIRGQVNFFLCGCPFMLHCNFAVKNRRWISGQGLKKRDQNIIIKP